MMLINYTKMVWLLKIKKKIFLAIANFCKMIYLKRESEKPAKISQFYHFGNPIST